MDRELVDRGDKRIHRHQQQQSLQDGHLQRRHRLEPNDIHPYHGCGDGAVWDPTAKRLVVVSYGGGHIGSAVTDIEMSGSIIFGSTTLNHVAPLYGATAGAAVASKALLVDANRSVDNINDLKATELTDQTQSPAQTLVTSSGTLASLAGDVTVEATEVAIKKIDAVTKGLAAADKTATAAEDRRGGVDDT
ncbi:hypothetical protein PHYPSEUDO_000466 [Phytophthora pseudosyringae]|uniref:Uncharacterized protein n=1 Tax=Phytophthora pseudosyringae TaxID=221518 RepID=A0A8T1VXR4_9STRA|nr:hypothetical protein PHYPSEUDO_000466 [Phytophthora pseudosyringae]